MMLRNCWRLHRQRGFRQIALLQFPPNLGLFWAGSAAKGLRQQLPRVTGGSPKNQFTSYSFDS
jgi:hypothetical protein